MDSFKQLILSTACARNTFVVVIDNDHAGSARSVVESWRDRLDMPLVFAIEPVRNIAMARNRGVEEALRRGADLVAFVDDDEVVDPHWLARLLDAQAEFDADAVSGAVVPVLPASAPRWLQRGRFFDQPRQVTGSAVRYLHTSNALVSATLLRGDHPPFDPAFGLSGGSDSLFFARWQRAGARFVWMDEAVVQDRIPASRARARWVLQRAFRIGNMAVHCERALPPGTRRVKRRLAKSVLRLAFGLAALLPLTMIRGRTGAVRALWSICFGFGSVAALTGYRYYEYRHIHGE